LAASRPSTRNNAESAQEERVRFASFRKLWRPTEKGHETAYESCRDPVGEENYLMKRGGNLLDRKKITHILICAYGVSVGRNGSYRRPSSKYF
jgi:hypothetical protein